MWPSWPPRLRPKSRKTGTRAPAVDGERITAFRRFLVGFPWPDACLRPHPGTVDRLNLVRRKMLPDRMTNRAAVQPEGDRKGGEFPWQPTNAGNMTACG